MLAALDQISQLRSSLEGLRSRLESHPLYREIRTLEHLRLFMQSHVFAVWDFMSLLKSLQASLTTLTIPWIPGPHAESARLINEIVLGEESDEYDGRHLSHFELYLEAMRAAAADLGPISGFLSDLRAGRSVESSLTSALIPSEARVFVTQTFSLLSRNQPHVTASAFTFGREDLIPSMFNELIREFHRESGGLDIFDYYLHRHIELDGDSHGPMSIRMVEFLCGSDEARWREAASAAAEALGSRIALWDGILARIRAA